jgi:hypothetical protein
MARHPSAIAWEDKLKAIFDQIDDWFEERYGHVYSLHPARAERGETSNKEDSGLFNIGAAYTAGFGSKHGPGYVVDVKLATLENVPKDIRAQVEKKVVEFLREELPKAFPDKELKVKKDGSVYKIFGDLSLGDV